MGSYGATEELQYMSEELQYMSGGIRECVFVCMEYHKYKYKYTGKIGSFL